MSSRRTSNPRGFDNLLSPPTPLFSQNPQLSPSSPPLPTISEPASAWQQSAQASESLTLPSISLGDLAESPFLYSTLPPASRSPPLPLQSIFDDCPPRSDLTNLYPSPQAFSSNNTTSPYYGFDPFAEESYHPLASRSFMPNRQRQSSSQQSQAQRLQTMPSVVDLTDNDEDDQPTSGQKRRLEDDFFSNSSKRSRLSRASPGSDGENIETVDLEEVDDDAKYDDFRNKERAAQIASQRQADAEKAKRLAAYQCIICLDSPTDLVVTHCGHLFCSQCLHEALNAATAGGKKSCPACRQAVAYTGKKAFYHLEMKFMTKSKGKQPVRT